MIKHIILWICVAAMAQSCITNRSNTYLQTDEKLPQYEKVPYTYYRIQPNDQLQIALISTNEEATSIFNINNSSSSSNSNTSNNENSYRVYDDGTIDIPFISHIPVAGLTIREASKAIEEKIRDFAPDAMVKVALANDNFYLIGEGKSSKYKIYKEKLNIFQALALVGDFNKNGDKRRIRIIRPNPATGKPIVKEFDMRTISIIDSEFYYIQPNDVIYVSSIKGDFFKVENYSSAIGSITTSINFLVTVINLGISF